jgi:hypothetical protein
MESSNYVVVVDAQRGGQAVGHWEQPVEVVVNLNS